MFRTELKNAGLDYLRVTGSEHQEKANMNGTAFQMMLEEQELGYKPTFGGFIGFTGRKTKHCFYGERGDWGMLQVSGFVCRDRFQILRRTAGRASRIDLQVTLKVPGKAAEMIQEAHDASLAQRPENGKKWKTKGIMEDGKMQTVYIGKRSSEWFGRIYDKYAESKQEEYKDCVRFEVEIKGKAAATVWKQLKEALNPEPLMQAIVRQWFWQHGVYVHVPRVPPAEAMKVKKPEHRDDAALGWLSKMVSGTVARLCATGHFFPAFQALFRQALTSSEMDGILYSVALIDS